MPEGRSTVLFRWRSLSSRRGKFDSHIKTILIRFNQFIFIEEGKLMLAVAGHLPRRIDGPRERKVYVKVLRTGLKTI